MSVDAKTVKILRDKTGAGMMDCKKALTETGGDMEKAIIYLREKGIASASKKSGRATKEGRIISYIHPGDKLGVLLEVSCETDFVARGEEFIEFVRDIAMHIAAAAPSYLTKMTVNRKKSSIKSLRGASVSMPQRYACWSSRLSRMTKLKYAIS